MQKIKNIFHYLILLKYVKLFSYWSARWLQVKLQKELNNNVIGIPDIFNRIQYYP